MIRKNIWSIIGYVLFALAAVIVLGNVYNYASFERTQKYFTEQVYPEYQTYDQNSNYLDGIVTLNNGYYDKDPIYTFTKETATEENPLIFTLNVYRIKFLAQGRTLYFFPASKLESGFLLEFKGLMYNGVDLMELNRPINSQEPPKEYLRLYLEFDQDGKDYYQPLSPASPLLLHDTILTKGDGKTFSTLTGISVAHFDLDDKHAPVNSTKKILFSANFDETRKIGDEHTVFDHTFDMSREKYLFSETEVSGKFPTDEELANLPTLHYTKLSLAKYNYLIALYTLGAFLFVLLAAYMLFVHKHVKAYFQQKRAEKRLADKRAAEMAPSGENVEADFEEVSDEHYEADFEETTTESSDSEDLDE